MLKFLERLLRKLTRTRGKSSKDSRLNGRLILRTLVILVILGGTAYGLRSYFVYRNCDVIRERADQAAEAGEIERAVGLYRQYLQLGRSIRRLSPGQQADVLERIVDLQEAAARESRVILALIAAEEELLRLDPGRGAVRSRLADRQFLLQRYGDSVAHLQLLRKDAPAADLPGIDERIAQCQVALRQFVEAQESWGRCLEAAPERTAAYVGLAKLWTESDVAPKLPDAMLARSEEWSDFGKRLTDSAVGSRLSGVPAAIGLLTLMREEIPGPSAQLATAQFVLELPAERETGVRSPQAADQELASVFGLLELDRNDGVIERSKRWDMRVPPFADRNGDGRITSEEFLTCLQRPARTARLDYVETLLSAATEATEVERIPLELDLTQARRIALQDVDLDQTQKLQREARRIAEAGLEHAELKVRCELLLGQLDLGDAAMAGSAAERTSALEAAERRARQGLSAMPERRPQFRYSATFLRDLETRQRLNLTLAEALLQRCESLPDRERAPLLTEVNGLVESMKSAGLDPLIVDSLRLHAALLARSPREMLLIASELKDRAGTASPWRRRTAGLLARAFHELGHPEQAVDVLDSLAKSEPLSAATQFSLAESLIAAGRSKESIPHLKAASNLPGAALRLCGILQRQLISLPPSERKWSLLDAMLKKAREVSPDSPELAAAELSTLRLKVWTDASLRSAAVPRLLEAEVEQLDKAFAAACERFPSDAAIWLARLQSANERIDLDEPERRTLVQKELDAARAALGTTPQLLLAEANALLPKDEAAAKDYLQEIERRAAELPAVGQAAVLSSLGIWRGSRENWDEARRLAEAACALAPKDNALRLQLVETLLRQQAARPDAPIPEKLWDESLAAIGRAEGTLDSTVAYLNAWRMLLGLNRESDAADRQKRLLEARQLIQKVERWRPTWSAVPRLRGLLLSLQGDREAAVKEWEHAFQLGDRSQEVIYAVLENLYKNERQSEFRDTVRQLESEDQSQLLGPLGRSVSMWVAARNDFGQAGELARKVAAKSGDPRDQLRVWQFNAAASNGLSDVSDDELLAFVTDRGRALPEAWEFLIQQRLRRGATGAQLDEIVKLAEQRLPAAPPETKPWTLARLHEQIGRERPELRVAEWQAAMEFYRKAVAAEPKNDLLRLSAVRMSLRFRDSQEPVELLQPLRDRLASLPPGVQRDVQLLTAQLALRDPGPAGRLLLRQALLEAVRLGDRTRATLQTLAAALERESSPAEQASAAALVSDSAGAVRDAASGLATARILAVAGRWPEAAARYRELEDEFPTSIAVKIEYLQQMLRRFGADSEMRSDAEQALGRLELIAPLAWETARARAAFLELNGQAASAIGLLTRTADVKLKQDSSVLISEWVERPDFLVEGERLLELMPADPAMQGAWGEVVKAQNGGDHSASQSLLAKPVLAPLVAEWRLLAIADAAGLLERLGAAPEAETLRRQVLAGSARTAAHVLELVGLLVRQQRVTEALELVGANWSRLDTLTAAATVSNIVRDAKLPAGKLQEARTRVIEAAAEETLPERRARLQLLIGDISQTMADWEGALAAYSRVTEIEPTNVVGLNNTAFMTAKLHKNPELARGAIQQAIKLAGAQPDLLDTSASVSIETGSPQTALQDLRNSPELERRGGLQARLAEALWQLGQKKEAVEAWSRARKLGWTLEQSHPLDRERHAEIDRADPAEAAPPQ
ncbi:hypothetical protein [Planctellipticum variicoloris]|uniref:hypothetical protein n=1 Tax=Planctellipticum variicoloris TaxID=3064265 RepID=UPI003013FE2B|nr:hypothetical protein SH412_002198 [Planctomycetaceae bacterium SH412]